MPSKDINLQTSRSEREKPIYQHLTEVTNECSDTEPVMFILQGNILYLELETIVPFVYASEFHIEGGLVLLSGMLFIQLFPITCIIFLND